MSKLCSNSSYYNDFDKAGDVSCFSIPKPKNNTNAEHIKKKEKREKEEKLFKRLLSCCGLCMDNAQFI